MANITDTDGWVDVTRPETTDIALGGNETNFPGFYFRQLASRDRFLLESLEALLGLGDTRGQASFDTFKDVGQAAITQGRLTPVAGSPRPTISSSDVATLYYTPDVGNQISLWNATDERWDLYEFTETAIAIGALAANTMYDVFVYPVSDVPTFQLVPWSNSTEGNATRAQELVRRNGILVSSSTDRKYLATFRTELSGRTSNTPDKSLIWNFYNPFPKAMRIQMLGVGTYSYSTAAWRAVNNNPEFRLRFVSGFSEAVVANMGLVKRGSSISASANIGLNSFTVASGDIWSNAAGGSRELISAQIVANLFGFDQLYMLEYGGDDGFGPIEFEGDYAAVGIDENNGRSGMVAPWRW